MTGPLRAHRPGRLPAALLLSVLTLTACAGSAATVRNTAAPSAAHPSPSVTSPQPPAFWALTGLPRPDGTTPAPALSIKIDNAPAARPQSGLNQADLVFECLVEGGLSRFLAVYESQSANLVGPIRSARPVDAALLRALQGGIFAYSGAANGEIAPVRASSQAFLLSHDQMPEPFFRQPGRQAPQNVYARTDVLRSGAGSAGDAQPVPTPLFGYGPAPVGSPAVASAALVIGGASTARWTWQDGSWARSEQGRPHLLSDGAQVTADNVVVLHVQVTGSGIRDAAGNEDPYVLATGSGTVEFLRDGALQRGTWSRPSLSDPYVFRSGADQPMTLTPGRTWVELVPTAGSATYG